LKSGTIIEAIYESQKKQISFVLDGKDCGVAFTDIDESELYPVIELHDNDVSITLVD
jgi:hypothetical protein